MQRSSNYLSAIALMLLAWSHYPSVAETPVLAVTQDGADAPVIVTVVGPQSLLDRAAEVAKLRKDCVIQQIFVQENFGINWGDDDRYGTHVEQPILGPDGCDDWLKHRYTVPGTYQVQAFLYHLGVTDAAYTDWKSSATVTVGGTLAALDFSLVDSAAGKTILYQQPLPIAWILTTGAPADLKLELVGEDGSVAVSETYTGLTYVGRGETTLRLQGNDYDALVKNDLVMARIRATITSGGQTLTRESNPFTLSNEFDLSSIPDLMPHAELVTGQPRTILFSHHSFHPTCHSYVIDWGDGSPVERSVVQSMPSGCSTETLWTKSTHTYAEPGEYRIKLRTNEYSLWAPPEESASYQAVTISVP